MEVERVHIGRELSALLERVMTMERGREKKGKQPECQRLLPHPSTAVLVSLFTALPLRIFVEA